MLINIKLYYTKKTKSYWLKPSDSKKKLFRPVFYVAEGASTEWQYGSVSLDSQGVQLEYDVHMFQTAQTIYRDAPVKRL